MNVIEMGMEIPQFVRDVTQFMADFKAAESLVAPQFPQLIADSQRLKADGEKLLGINDIAAPMAPPPTTAS